MPMFETNVQGFPSITLLGRLADSACDTCTTFCSPWLLTSCLLQQMLLAASPVRSFLLCQMYQCGYALSYSTPKSAASFLINYSKYFLDISAILVCKLLIHVNLFLSIASLVIAFIKYIIPGVITPHKKQGWMTSRRVNITDCRQKAG